MNYICSRKGCFVFLAAAVVTGCGGGSSGSGNTQGTTQSTNVGDARVSFIGSAKPAILGTETGLTVNTLAGASITNFTVEPATVDSNTTVAWLAPVAGEVLTYQRGTVSHALDTVGNGATDLAFGHDGELYYTGTNTPLAEVIEKSYYDGSTLSIIYNEVTTPIGNVAISPNDATIAADYFNGGFFTVNSSGGSYKLIDSAGIEPAFSPNGATIAYVKMVNGVSQLFTVPVGGGTATQITTGTESLYYPSYAPNGQSVVCDYDNGTTRNLAVFQVAPGLGIGTTFAPYTSGTWASHASFSPDGAYVTYSTSSTYNPSAGSTYIVISDLSGTSIQTVGLGTRPAWAPFPATRQFIGTNGVMFTSAAGLVYTQQQTGFQSLVTFQATTPADAKITLESQTGSPTAGPLVYDLHADDITGLRYANLYVDTSIGISIGTSDVLLTIDANSGTVDAVAPFLSTRGGMPKCVKANGTLTWTANFAAVWNSTGKNVAPSGATTLVLDAKKGTLLSVH